MTKSGLFAQRSASQTQTLRFAAEKAFIHKVAMQGNGRTSLKSISWKVRGWEYLWDKEVGRSEVWGQTVEVRER